jgi:adenosylcobyric acid synthase
MLGRKVSDPEGIEGSATEAEGLGLLDVTTVLEPRKVVRNVTAVATEGGLPVDGYEIHMGRTTGPDCSRPMMTIAGKPDGATSKNGRTLGCYMHGLFASDPFRRDFLGRSGGTGSGGPGYRQMLEDTLDDLAARLEETIDLERVLACAGPTR